MNYFRLLFLSIFILSACTQKPKTGKENSTHFISIVSLIREQVAHIDTSLYSIIKIDSVDNSQPDTTFIPREKFREVAKDFLAIPDLSQKKVASDFREESVIYDTLLNRVIFTYVPVEGSGQEFKKMELLATPKFGEESRIDNIIVDWETVNKDSSQQKRMLWIMNKSFQIMTTTQKPGKPKVNVFTRVIWSDGLQ